MMYIILRLEVNCRWFMLWAVARLNLVREVRVVEDFVYLGALTHSSIQSSPDNRYASAQCSYAYGHAEYGQVLLEVTNLNISEAEIVQSCCMAQNVGQSPK